MEIVKTDYQSSPGLPLRSLIKPAEPAKTPAPEPPPPAPIARPPQQEWLWWAVLMLAIALSLLLARVLPR